MVVLLHGASARTQAKFFADNSVDTCMESLFSSENVQKTQKYLIDHYLHFLKLHIINNYINSLFIRSRRLPLRPHVVAGMIRLANHLDSSSQICENHHVHI